MKQGMAAVASYTMNTCTASAVLTLDAVARRWRNYGPAEKEESRKEHEGSHRHARCV